MVVIVVIVINHSEINRLIFSYSPTIFSDCFQLFPTVFDCLQLPPIQFFCFSVFLFTQFIGSVDLRFAPIQFIQFFILQTLMVITSSSRVV